MCFVKIHYCFKQCTPTKEFMKAKLAILENTNQSPKQTMNLLGFHSVNSLSFPGSKSVRWQRLSSLHGFSSLRGFGPEIPCATCRWLFSRTGNSFAVFVFCWPMGRFSFQGGMQVWVKTHRLDSLAEFDSQSGWKRCLSKSIILRSLGGWRHINLFHVCYIGYILL